MSEGEVPLCAVREMLVVIEMVHSPLLEAESARNMHMDIGTTAVKTHILKCLTCCLVNVGSIMSISIRGLKDKAGASGCTEERSGRRMREQEEERGEEKEKEQEIWETVWC